MAKNLNKDAVYRAAKPKDKDYTISDGDGLVLLVKNSGVKRWRFDYRIEGKQNRLGFGVYPGVSLDKARRKAEEARAQIANGIDPSEAKKQSKQAGQVDAENAKRKAAGLPILGSFEHAARDWLASIEHLTGATTHIKKTSRLERLAFPILGDMAITAIKSADVLETLKPLIDKSQLETAHRLHSEISAIFAYAIVHNRTDYDPAQPEAKQIPAQKAKHRAAIIDPKQVGQLLRDISNY